jgi:arsenate reductase
LTAITIYHNPACGTSRNTLAMIRNSGVEPTIIEYLKTPPTRETLLDLIARMGVPVRAVLRERARPMPNWGWMIRPCRMMPCWMPSWPTRSC